MSIYIPGMEMPKERPQLLWIYPDGKVITVKSDADPEDNFNAVPVPPHGRCIDTDIFESIKYELPDGQKAFNRGFHSGVQYVQRLIMDAPTVLEAEEG